MKKAFHIILTIVALLCITGCSDSSTTEVSNPLIDKIYISNTTLENTFDFDFIKFYDDNTFQGIKASFQKNYTTGENEPIYTDFYGTYNINENALTLNMSENSFSGAITDNGSSIKFDNDEFIDWTSHIDSTDPILSEFK